MLLNESYFNGDRLAAYQRLIGAPVDEEKTMFENIYGEEIKLFEDAILMNRLTVFNGVGFVTLKKDRLEIYKEYKLSQSRFVFEQKMLNINFQFLEEHYDKIVRYKDGLIYFFSNIDKEERVDNVIIKVGTKEFFFDRKEVSRFSLIDVDLEYLWVLDRVGTIRNPEREARPESADNGQMKICCDAVKASQLIAGVSGKRILIVGSSSEGYGGGRTYNVMDAMFENSEFHLYDPYEVNADYVTDRGNRFVRRAKVFDYESRNLAVYDLVLDDAYVSPENNRILLDPGMSLLKHPAFSCKCFQNDMRFFKKFYLTKQVGYTESGERRAMSRAVIRQEKKDKRFGSCQFCLELFQYVPEGKYDDVFFERWRKIHPPHYPCAVKIEGMVKGGDILTDIGEMFAEYEVPPTFSVDYDPVLHCEVVNVVDKNVGWYQFSDLEKVPKDFRAEGKFCVFVEEANCYLTSRRLDTICPQHEVDNMKIINGIYFVSYKGVYTKHATYKAPLQENVWVDDISALPSMFNFYSSVVVCMDAGMWKSLPKIRYKR